MKISSALLSSLAILGLLLTACAEPSRVPPLPSPSPTEKNEQAPPGTSIPPVRPTPPLAGATAVATQFSDLVGQNTGALTSFTSNGDRISGWYWLRDQAYQASGQWVFKNLDPQAQDTTLFFDLLVTNGVSGGSGYSMPLKITLTNPGSGESKTFEDVIAQNVLPEQNSANSQGYGYQAYGSLTLPAGFINHSGGLDVIIQRPEGHPYHLAVNQNSVKITQDGIDVAGGGAQGGSLPGQTPSDQASCEAIGGEWGTWGLAPKEQCNIPTGDGGKACTNSSQCKSLCLAELTPEEFNEAFREGKTFQKGGACAQWTIVVGCVPVVQDGFVQILCID